MPSVSVDSERTSPSSLDAGMRVDVYRNLKHGGLSVVDRSTTTSPTYGRVLTRVPEIYLESVSFESYEGKRQETLESGRKNVHAFLRGAVAHPRSLPEGAEVQYTVSRPGCWYSSGERVMEAEHVRVSTVDEVAVKAVGICYDGEDRYLD